MRLNLFWRGYDLIDIEVHALRQRPTDGDDNLVVEEDSEHTEIPFGFSVAD